MSRHRNVQASVGPDPGAELSRIGRVELQLLGCAAQRADGTFLATYIAILPDGYSRDYRHGRYRCRSPLPAHSPARTHFDNLGNTVSAMHSIPQLLGRLDRAKVPL
jgi:hypothetical protein